MKRKNAYICLFFVMFIIFTSFTQICFADNSTKTQVKELKQKIEQLSKEKTELSDKLALQTEINNLLVDKENNIISSTDNTINRINTMLTLLSIIVGIIIAVSTVGTFVLQNYRFNLLEKEIDKSKEDYNKSIIKFNESNIEFDKSKEDYNKSKEEFENVKIEARAAAECAAATQDSYDDIQKGYETITKDLEGIKISFISLADDRINEIENNYTKTKDELNNIIVKVNLLVEKAKESENNAKESENKAKASEYFNKAYNSNNLDEKVALYTKALEYDNNHNSAYHNRGIVYSKQKKHNRALEDFNNAINIAPNRYLYHLNRAGTLCDLAVEYKKSSEFEKYSESRDNSFKDYQRALELVPEGNSNVLSDFYNNRAVSYLKLENTELALEDLKKAIEVNDKNGYIYSTLAEICALQNDDVGFYKNAELCLKNNCPLWEFAEVDPIYDKYKNTQKFKKLIDIYKVPNK